MMELKGKEQLMPVFIRHISKTNHRTTAVTAKDIILDYGAKR
jgi:hypothetical protein